VVDAAARSVPVGEVRRLGDHALLIGVPGPAGARTLTRLLREAHLEGVAEVVGGLATVMVAFDPAEDVLESRRPEVTVLLERALAARVEEAEGSLLQIPCSFDGPDLAGVAAHVGTTPDGVVALLMAQTLTVEAVGFSPGFAYLGGLPPELRGVHRRSRPRPFVPAGSVALANGYAAVYPSATPGGWQLVGRTDEPLFTPFAAPFARLSPGDRVQFVRAEEADQSAKVSTFDATPARDVAPLTAAARRVFVVEEPGVRSVLQDAGRRGVAALGVPAATPADPVSFRLANQLVGNSPDAVALELTARGPTLRCLESSFIAVVGASPGLRVDGQTVEANRVVPLQAGQRLVVGPIRGGFRCYLARAGGFAGPVVLGSCASDQLAGLGPGPLRGGDELWGADMVPPLGDHLRDDAPTSPPGTEPCVLRVVPGPHPERFAPGAFAALSSMRFTVDPESNRVGLRLRRDRRTAALLSAPGAAVELDSQGTVTGAMQVPPDGEPVILLTDHATLGGYPVIAVVAVVDHGVLGQCAPGSAVALVPLDHAAATDALRAHERILRTAVVGHYPLAVE
jgi:KipI family sensor histidine kinase inhibitor